MSKYYEQIEAYISGQLDSDELAAFERALTANDDLKAAVNNHDIAKVIFDGLEEEDIRAQVEKVKKRETGQRIRMWWGSIAAGVAILLGIVVGISISGGDSYDDLYAEYFDYKSNEWPASISATRSDEDNIFSQARALYGAGKSEEALSSLANASEPNAMFMRAIIQMKQENFEEAEGLLNELIETRGDQYLLYRGLCRLKLNNISGAKEDLGILSAKGDNKAKNILNEIK